MIPSSPVDVAQRIIYDACNADANSIFRSLTIEQMERFFTTSVRFQLRLVPIGENVE